MNDLILILDFGAQYTQLIARRVRELGVKSEIVPYFEAVENLRRPEVKGIILSGGPSSVYAENAPLPSAEIFELGVPVLGICYGLQVMAHLLGGKVEGAVGREYGRAFLSITSREDLFHSLEEESSRGVPVWMSHGDRVAALPQGFEVIAASEGAPHAAVRHSEKHLYGVQFHPEVAHTPSGTEMLRNFVFTVCGCAGGWSMASFKDQAIAAIREQVGEDGQVICGLSGGVDSSVAALLLHEAIGDRLICIFVDNGLLRKNERSQVESLFREHYHLRLEVVDASQRFLSELAGVTDPETKRKTIGRVFIEVFDEAAQELQGIDFLAQGTLYPDVIESVSVKGPSAVIKSHHNVGGLPEKMNLKLVEPLRELFKDEVRELGKELGLPDDLLWRHPFPGPGLAVRILGEITESQLAILREADAIFLQEIKAAGLYRDIWQAFAVLLPVKAVGVQGDARTYEQVITLRAVQSSDGMTADWFHIPYEVLAVISNRIINEIPGVARVAYDISSKPPATIEWE